EPVPAGVRSLLETIVARGHLVTEAAPVRVARDRAMASLGELPDTLRDLAPTVTYPVEMSAGLQAMRAEVIADYEIRDGHN
ncbi:MAG TPA: hypothetical protein VEW66_06530, partial [Thermomicrobiales bacterium]|nr:hypothetical protein [Thermomicrobiales bacterium]